jgi:cell division septum initiation protein DivIVA
MESTPAGPTAGPAIQGYSRAEVDDFLSAASVERARLEAEIASANERINRARAAIGIHRVMFTMLLDVQREINDLRRGADEAAASIVQDAEREASAARAWTPESAPLESLVQSGSTELDLTLHAARFDLHGPTGMRDQISDDDKYFDFLRGALIEEEPLGGEHERT